MQYQKLKKQTSSIWSICSILITTWCQHCLYSYSYMANYSPPYHPFSLLSQSGITDSWLWLQQHLDPGTCLNMGQVTKLRLSCYLVLLSIDSKTRSQDSQSSVTWPIYRCHHQITLIWSRGWCYWDQKAFNRMIGFDWLMLYHPPIMAKHFAKSFWLKVFNVSKTDPRFLGSV